MTTEQTLRDAIETEVRTGGVSLDLPVYQEAGRDPFVPLLYGGSPAGRVAFFARDLGRHEVLAGEPLIGDAGQRVRRALYTHLFHAPPPDGDVRLERAVQSVLLANTVPYKPVGNKAYPAGVKERLRPWIAQLLVQYWQGDYVITMGTEAFQWFQPYAESRAAFDAFWKRDDRYEAEFPCVLTAQYEGETIRKSVTLAPLPHPSPLNQTWFARFPALLQARLAHSPLASSEAGT